MDDQIGAIQQELRELNTQLRQGAIYQSLGNRVGQLMDGIHRQRRTPVAVVDDNDGIVDLLKMINQTLKDEQAPQLTEAELLQLLAHLRSTNPRIRYSGVHFTLYDVLEDGGLGANQIQWLVQQLLQDQRLFDHILEPANQAVFGRSAAVSFLGTLIHYSNDHPQLKGIDYAVVVNQIATYMCLETDTRGFLNQHGWAHAFTSLIDLLATLIDSPQLPRADKLFLMVILIERYKRLTTPLICGETGRMSGYLVKLTNRHVLYEDACLTALKQWRQQIAEHPTVETTAGWTQFYNRQRLLDALKLRRDLSPRIRTYLTAAIDFLA